MVSPAARQTGLLSRSVVTMHRNAKPLQNFCFGERASNGPDTRAQIALRQRVGGGVRSCMRLLTSTRFSFRVIQCLPRIPWLDNDAFLFKGTRAAEIEKEAYAEL